TPFPCGPRTDAWRSSACPRGAAARARTFDPSARAKTTAPSGGAGKAAGAFAGGVAVVAGPAGAAEGNGVAACTGPGVLDSGTAQMVAEIGEGLPAFLDPRALAAAHRAPRGLAPAARPITAPAAAEAQQREGGNSGFHCDQGTLPLTRLG